MSYLLAHWGDVLHRMGQHLVLAGVPLLLGLLVAIPVGWWARARHTGRVAVVTLAGLLFTIPSLVLFVLMPIVLGTRILSPLNVVVAMTLYTLALLVRTVVDGLEAVPDVTRQAATAMGFGRVRRLLQVELPLAVPVLAGGLRVAAVSNVSIVSVAALLGIPNLGYYLMDGYQRNFAGEIWTGILACVVLALLLDLAIVLVARRLTRWQGARAA